MFFASIASGSSGNCIYIGTEETHILVDCGVSCRKIESGLEGFGISPDELSGILITHEHSDHIKGVGTFVKKHQIPVYGTIETLAAMKRSNFGKAVPMELLMNINTAYLFNIGDIEVTATEVSHDAAHPVCYRLSDGLHSVSMATDLGEYDSTIVEHLSEAELIYLESNYDPEMLMVGPYPYYLKQRIDGPLGHLSNEVSTELIHKVLHPKLKHIVLAHLSKENNFPEIAYQTHKNMLDQNWCFDTGRPEIYVAGRDEPSVSLRL